MDIIKAKPVDYFIQEDRALGTLIPVSISSAAAIEKIIKDVKLTNGYTHLYINVRTLFRNFRSSYQNNKEMDIDIDTLVEGLLNELELIKTAVDDNLRLKLVYYFPSYKSLSLCFPNAKIKTNFTPKQKTIQDIEKIVFSKILNRVEAASIRIFDVKIQGDNTSSLIITSYPVDLLSQSTFRKISLLESVTGNIKNKTEFITKLSKNEHYRNIPFNVLSIQIIGDKSTLLESQGQLYTGLLVNMVKDYNWTALTTLEKVKFDINKLKNKETVNKLMKMCLATLR